MEIIWCDTSVDIQHRYKMSRFVHVSVLLVGEASSSAPVPWKSTVLSPALINHKWIERTAQTGSEFLTRFIRVTLSSPYHLSRRHLKLKELLIPTLPTWKRFLFTPNDKDDFFFLSKGSGNITSIPCILSF